MLSIVIPTLNEEKYLPLLLMSLSKQTYRDFEVIVADAGSKDNTRRIAEAEGCRVVDGGLPAVGRNNGAKVARGEWLLFVDADVILPPDFLEKALAEIEEKKLRAATCLVKPLSDKLIDVILHETVNIYLQGTEKIYPHAAGFCIFAEKKAHDAEGGFNEGLKLAEDHDYVRRVGRNSRFGILGSVHVPVSVRRLDKDGRFTIAMKYLAVEMHRIFLGEIYSNIFDYEFGQFK